MLRLHQCIAGPWHRGRGSLQVVASAIPGSGAASESLSRGFRPGPGCRPIMNEVTGNDKELEWPYLDTRPLRACDFSTKSRHTHVLVLRVIVKVVCRDWKSTRQTRLVRLGQPGLRRARTTTDHVKRPRPRWPPAPAYWAGRPGAGVLLAWRWLGSSSC